MRKKTRKKSKRKYVRRRKYNTFRQSMTNLLKLILLIAACVFVIYYIFFRPTSKKPVPISESKKEKKVAISSLSKPEAIDYSLNEIFERFNLLQSWISKQDNTFKVRLAQDIPAVIVLRDIINKMEELDFQIINSREDLPDQQFTIEIGDNDKLIRKLILINEQGLKRFQGKIALIIDDFGYSESQEVEKLLQTSFPITISIIPGLPKSKELYQQAQNQNKETIIHLPMEAIDEKVEYTEYTIYASNMTDENIISRVRKAIEDFPASKGMNNHMGSKVTADKHVMQLVLEELKKSNKYFVDSKTNSKSIAFKTAQQVKIPSAENNMFLDQSRSDSEDYLRKKLIALTRIASKTGRAIAIGHPYPNTVKVLVEEIPKLESQGYTFIPVSELVQ